ncbi:DUF4870 domain-containing protein [bacterium]|nr:DUF4870 domain-containing protein [bacterium]
MSIADDLERLRQLYQSGDLSEDEYAQAKAAVLGRSDTRSSAAGERASSDDSGSYVEAAGSGPREGRQPASRSSMAQWLSEDEWAMVLHLSQFAGYVAPVLGFVLPILIWQVLKDDLPSLDRHGRIVMNWVISEVLYLAIAILLAFVAIGFVLVPVVGVLGVVFPVIGALKANGGTVWEYPLSIRFFRLDERRSGESW